MVDVAPPPSRRKLVGQPLLYAISVFASLGVFLVSYVTRGTRHLKLSNVDTF